MLILEEAIKKFSELPALAQAVFNEKANIQKILFLEEKYQISLTTLLIYAAINEVSDTAVFLENELNVEHGKAKLIAKEVDNNLLNPLIERLNFVNPDQQKNFSLPQEKNYAADLFKGNLRDVLNGEMIICEAINLQLFYILASDFDFTNNLASALLANNEKLTRKEFNLNGKPARPTIANWLKDFIKANGAEMFDNLVLTEYLINSGNTKKLDKTEKDTLKKLLLLYRNLKFFPESMGDIPPESWEIIPIDHIENEKIKPRMINNGFKNSLKEDEIKELKNLLARYPEGSLERKAVEEEIKKLTKI